MTIHGPSSWGDHRFQDRAVLPAVEAMQLLANECQRYRPAMNVHRIGRARFDKFLALPPDGGPVDAYCDLVHLPDGGLRTALLTRVQARSARISRVVTHARVDFLPDDGTPAPRKGNPSAPLAEDCFKVDPPLIYSQLVPFGPAYRNIVQPLMLNRRGARAVIQAPDHLPSVGSLGSPYVLDAAFHAACVWGQRFAGVVAFPVALAERRILAPTRPGGEYIGRIRPLGQEEGMLRFDLDITDPHGQWYEWVRGVDMRDVSGGRLKPPGWIRRGGSKKECR